MHSPSRTLRAHSLLATVALLGLVPGLAHSQTQAAAGPAPAPASVSAPASASAAATTATTSPALPAKPYSLFMGNDIALEYKKDFYPLTNVVGSDMTIKVKGETKIIPRRDMGNFKLNYGLKLSHIAVTIDGLTVERAFTPANDPGRKFVEQMAANQAMQTAVEDQAVNTAIRQYRADAAVASAASAPASGPGGAMAKAAAMDGARIQHSQAYSAPMSASYNGGNNTAGMDAEAFDAIEVSFKVTSPVRLENPYFVMIAEYKLKDDKPNESHRFIFGRNLDAIGIAPTEVSFKAGGLPAGFQVINQELHLYQNARELATNLSEKRVDMTRDQAYTYTLINYLSSHKKDTLPASALLMPNPEAGRVRISRAKLYEPVFVRVDPKGKVLRVSMDAAGKVDPKPELAEALRDFVFLPALDKGVAVEGTLSVRMLDYL